MSTSNDNLAGALQRVINKLIFLEKRIIFQHGGVKLHPSEIHLMQLIQAEKRINATQMARQLGITKGAVSQTLTRLGKKGVLQKSKDPQQKNELTASFTHLGQEAIAAFENQQARRTALFADYMGQMPTQDRQAVAGFLDQMERFLAELAK